MKKIVVLAVLVSLSFIFGCKKDSDQDVMENAFRVGVKYAQPLKILSQNLFTDKMVIYFDGGNSAVNIQTGKWTGNGGHWEFTFNNPASTTIPIGIFSLDEDITATYNEDYNNDGPMYCPNVKLTEGVFKTEYSNLQYKFQFVGIDENDSTVLMNYTGAIDYIFDNRN